jgi:hypothetical protein
MSKLTVLVLTEAQVPEVRLALKDLIDTNAEICAELTDGQQRGRRKRSIAMLQMVLANLDRADRHSGDARIVRRIVGGLGG